MNYVPLVLRVARPTLLTADTSRCEGPTVEEPLPAELKLDANGCVLTRGTRITEVQRETTDDK